MALALEDRQAEQVRANSTNQHVVAVIQQMVGGNGCAYAVRCSIDKVNRVGGGDVLENHLQGRESLDQTDQLLIDKGLFAIKNVHLGMSHFAMHQQRHAYVGHRFQRRINVL